MLAENASHQQSRALRVVRNQPESTETLARHKSLALARTPHVRRFIAAAAAHGLTPENAIRLAAERFVTLEDLSALGLDGRAVKYMLHRAAARERPGLALSDAQADYARSLSLPAPIDPPPRTRSPLPYRNGCSLASAVTSAHRHSTQTRSARWLPGSWRQPSVDGR
jgi:hypothetical protein